MDRSLSVDEYFARLQELTQRGLLEAADAACRELVEAVPSDDRAWSWLGVVAMLRGDLTASEAAFRKAAMLAPHDDQNWSNLGAALIGLKRDAEAESCFQRAIQIDGTKAGNWSNLATAFTNQGRWTEAAAALRRSVELDPQSSAVWGRLGATEKQLGRLATAQEAFEKSISLASPNLETIIQYANVLSQRGQPTRAIEILRSVLSSVPNDASAWLAMGIAQQLKGDAGQAEAAYRRALELAPKSQEGRYLLAMQLLMGWKTSEAKAFIDDLLAEHPLHADAWIALGLIEQSRSRHEQAISAIKQAVGISANPKHHSSLLQCLQYPDSVTPEGLLAAHREWEASYVKTSLPPPERRAANSDQSRRLKIGFLSPDFTRHPVAFLVLPALESLDRSACSVVCYSDRVAEDEFTRRFQATSDEWRVVAGLSDEEIANLVREDEVDVLFDLAGHFSNRLLVFAHKPAKVQITWLGYVGTTGLAAMDYLLADRFHVREGEEDWYAEEILRMPNAYACFGPPVDAPPVGPLPAAAAGYVTFGCFNGPQKFAERIVEAWAAILRQVPHSRLVLKYAWLGHTEEQALVRERFSKLGIDPARILIEGWSPPQELLANYNQVDIALDTQPYSGGLTTCEALWMGVPVITFPGKTFAGRHATSYLVNAGYPQFVAQDYDSYVALAVDWSKRLEELAEIRQQMREQVRRSALCEAKNFARELLALLVGASHSRNVAPRFGGR